MATNDVHEPSLPGVRTLGKDLKNSSPDDQGVTFFDTHRVSKKENGMTTPEAVVEKSNTHSSGSNSFLTNEDDVFNVSEAFDDGAVQTGTIVSDKRHAHGSLTRVVSGAFNEWWGKTRSQLEDSYQKIEKSLKKEVQTVEKPEARKEVIKEAAKYTAQAPRDDHRVVVEKLKTLSRDAEHVTGKPFIVKEPSVQEAPTWKHTVETNSIPQNEGARKKERALPTLDLRSVSIAPSVERHIEKTIDQYARPTPPVRVLKKPEPVSVPRVPVHHAEVLAKDTGINIAPTVNTRSDVRLKVAERPHAPEMAPVPPRSPKGSWGTSASKEDEGVRTTVPTPPRSTPAFETPPPIPVSERREPAPVYKTSPIPPERLNRAPLVVETVTSREMSPHKPASWSHSSAMSPRAKKFSFRTIFLFVVVGVGAVLGIIAGVMYVGSRTPSESPSETVATQALSIPSFFVSEKQISVPLGTSREVLLSKLSKELRASSGTVQMYPVIDELGVSRPALTEEILDVLAPRAPGSFLRTLSETLMIGAVTTDTKEPFIILSSNNFDVAFAGMLQWEQSMSADLVPFFGPRVTATLLPTSGSTSSTPPRFTDALKENRSIRILYDKTGAERIIYAFVNRNTIIITTSTSALSKIIGKIK